MIRIRRYHHADQSGALHLLIGVVIVVRIVVVRRRLLERKVAIWKERCAAELSLGATASP
jgi:hypothetical protein